ncbi:hypothetical protein [Microbacterium sp. SS28]|uniref:hypothetical protein n=1 Tax=Microbacterium sp. SS28 TaxID=2919948 RepID=UPI001FAAA389|nr:hypothetical protein [Microbacterium sp. SS28]
MATRTKDAASIPSLGARARRAALLALPFQVGSIVIAHIVAATGRLVDLPLTYLLVLAYAVPMLIELVFRTSLPRVLQLTYLTFIAASSFAGSALQVYWNFPPWDFIVHAYSGLMLAWLGMLLLRRVEERIGVGLPVWFSCTVMLLFAMAGAAAWELSEFGSDIIIGTAAQHSNEDSMTDMLAGTLGGAIAILIALVLRRPESLAPESLLRRPSRPGR